MGWTRTVGAEECKEADSCPQKNQAPLPPTGHVRNGGSEGSGTQPRVTQQCIGRRNLPDRGLAHCGRGGKAAGTEV